MALTKTILVYSTIFMGLLGLAGCTRIVDWVSCTFYQGEELTIEDKIPFSLVRSITIYNQFATVAHFDALWLSDQVRSAYINLHIRTLGKSEEQKTLLLKRQLDENKHFIMFFVLSPYEIPLGETNAEWKVFLDLNGIFYDPIEIKTVDLLPIYKLYLGKHYNRFKLVYQIKFDARDAQDNPLINADVAQIILRFRSAKKEGQLCWDTAPVSPVIEVDATAEQCSPETEPEARNYTARLRKKLREDQ